MLYTHRRAGAGVMSTICLYRQCILLLHPQLVPLGTVHFKQFTEMKKTSIHSQLVVIALSRFSNKTHFPPASEQVVQNEIGADC